MRFEDLRSATQSAHDQGENIVLAVDGIAIVVFQHHHNKALCMQLLSSPGQSIDLNTSTFEETGLRRARPADFSARFFHQEAV